jgi:hypothetical protein
VAERAEAEPAAALDREAAEVAPAEVGERGAVRVEAEEERARVRVEEVLVEAGPVLVLAEAGLEPAERERREDG